jgi:hypothetical protein
LEAPAKITSEVRSRIRLVLNDCREAGREMLGLRMEVEEE